MATGADPPGGRPGSTGSGRPAVASELSLTGYGCEDMFFVADFIENLSGELVALANQLPEQLLITVGFADPRWSSV